MSKVKDLAAQIAAVEVFGLDIQNICHRLAKAAGWWTNLRTDELYAKEEVREMVPTKLMLIVSECAEAMEGHRKQLMDDKLPHREALEVELADAAIRIFDLAGALGFDLGAAMAQKLKYNATREDHTIAARKSAGGKAY